MIVIGVAGDPDLAATRPPDDARFSVKWQRLIELDKDNREDGRPAVSIEAVHGECAGEVPLRCLGPQRRTAYYVFSVVPGLYHFSGVTRGKQSEGATIWDFGRSGGDTLMTVIQAGPGEVVYAGDFWYDAATRPFKLRRHERNDQNAFRALAEHPGIVVGPIYRAPTNLQDLAKSNTRKDGMRFRFM